MFVHDHTKCKTADLRLNIFTAAQWGDLHSVMHSVDVRGADASKEDDYGFTALHHAATNGHLAIVEFLMSRNANINASRCGCTALHRACARGHTAIAKLLLSHPLIRINEKDSSTGDGRTPLAKAIVNARVDIIDLLLATKGIDVNSVDSHNRSIWQLASSDLRVRLEAAGAVPGPTS